MRKAELKRDWKYEVMLVFKSKLKKRFGGKNDSALRAPHSALGFTLVELVVTLVVLSVLALGTIPLLQNSVRRQKEQRLRETLRDIRQAIDEFKRDATGSCVGVVGGTGGTPKPPPIPGMNPGAGSEPRTRVVISDCEIFEVENLDRYPPSLDVLVEGVKVRPRAGQAMGGQGGIGLGNTNRSFSDVATLDATDEKEKVYLRGDKIPIDPITGEADWKIRSCYQEKDAAEWDNINVFDVRSAAEGEALDGTKYSDF
jgi:general secretion pathway protein G